MASDNNASYAKIGFTIVLGVAAIVVALVYIGGIWDRGEEVFVETCYDRPVSGLSVGSPVNMRGVQIGEVREISFIGDKYDVPVEDRPRIYILMALKKKMVPATVRRERPDPKERTRVLVEKFGLRASVTSSGITGLSRIECDFNPENPPEPPVISWVPVNPYVPPKMSLLDDFSVSATKVMDQINKMDLNAAWSNIASTVQSLAQATDSARVMLETRQADIERVIEDLSSASAAIRDLTQELKRNPSLLIRERTVVPLEETK